MQQNSGGANFAPTCYTNVITTTYATTPYYVSPIITQTIMQTSPTISSAYITDSYLNRPSTPTTMISETQNSRFIDNTQDEILSWQEVPARRKTSKRFRGNEATSSENSTKRININNEDTAAANSNRFAILENIEDEEYIEKNNTNNNSDPKPPPIFIQGVVNYLQMLATIETVLEKTEFSCKTLTNNTVKINTNKIDGYRKLTHLLKTNNIASHTYQPRQERSYRVVLKNLHQSIPTEDIKKALEEKGFKIRNVSNIRSWNTKEPLPLFFVDQEPNEHNKKIYDLVYLLNTKIQIEPPRKKKEIPQCLRCQEYGHTKSYCTKQYYCVKCAASHPTSQCDKSKDIPAKCVLCNGPHPANYKGCTVYRELQKGRDKATTDNINKYTNNYNNEPNARKNYEIKENRSYAQVTKETTIQTDNTTNIPQQNTEIILSTFLNKFEIMFTQLMNQNSMIINMLSTLVKNIS